MFIYWIDRLLTKNHPIMKILFTLLLSTNLLFSTQLIAQKSLSPYIKVGASSGSLAKTEKDVTNALEGQGFKVLGSYHPENNSNLSVIAFTRKDLQDAVIGVKDRGGLAGILKVGLVKKGNSITISYLNPEYLFNAYLRTKYQYFKTKLSKVTADTKSAMSALGSGSSGFGGSEEAEGLQKYHYMMMMPYFDDPVELNEYSSFEEGLGVIRKNLTAKKGNTVKVFELVYKDKQVAVFGVGLMDEQEGEAEFLPIIGEDHIAAMPYEIILQGKEVTMLHGKYRFALHWPELTMGTFMKINSTPGNVEDMLAAICKP